MLTTLLEAFASEIGEEQLVGRDRPVRARAGHRRRPSVNAQEPRPLPSGESPASGRTPSSSPVPYAGENTPILDCTIRDPKTGGVDWNPNLLDVLRTGISQQRRNLLRARQRLRRSAGPPSRHQVVAVPHKGAAGRHRRRRHGDPERGLSLRYPRPRSGSSSMLLTHIPVPAGKRLLFCSGFCQKAYRAALGNAGRLHGQGRGRGHDSRRPMVLAPGRRVPDQITHFLEGGSTV